MHVQARRPAFCAYALVSLSLFGALGSGCKSQTPSQNSGQNRPKTPAEINAQAPAPPQVAASQAVSDRLRQIASAGKLESLARPDFSDYRLHFQ
ncbi:MAG: hypothetical protein JOZ83_10460, partial [Silvibacterium sp.]|nr:hypothetical protein [Silvibacterium sp.]